MLTGGVVVMGDVQIFVDVVVAKGNFGIDIQLLGVCPGDVQQPQFFGNFLWTQQIQTVGIFVCGDLMQLSLAGQAVCKGIRRKALMVGVNAGVNDCNPGACTGITGGPGMAAANLQEGCGHVGIRSFLGVYHTGLVAGLHHHVLHARKILNGLNLTVGNVGRDDVGRQGQIPDHIQRFLGHTRNAGCHIGLVVAQIGAIGHGGGVASNVCGGKPGFQSGFLVQNDGHTDQIGAGIVWRILNFVCSVLPQFCGNGAVVHLPETQGAGFRRCGMGWKHQAQKHRSSQNQRKQAFDSICLFHMALLKNLEWKFHPFARLYYLPVRVYPDAFMVSYSCLSDPFHFLHRSDTSLQVPTITF